MKVASVAVAVAVLGGLGFAGMKGLEIHDAKINLENQIADYSMHGLHISHDPIKYTDMLSDTLSLTNVYISTNIGKLSADSLALNGDPQNFSGFALVGVTIDSEKVTGNASIVTFENFDWSLRKKDMRVSYSGLNLQTPIADFSMSKGFIDIQHTGEKLLVEKSLQSNVGDTITLSSDLTLKNGITDQLNLTEGFAKAAINEVELSVLDAGFLSTIKNKMPEAVLRADTYHTKMDGHYFPKADRIAKQVSTFIEDKKTLHVIAKPKAPLPVSTLGQLDLIEPMQLINFLNLEVKTN